MSQGDDARAHSGSRRSTLHLTARRATLLGLLLSAAALTGLMAWTCYVRATWTPGRGFTGSIATAKTFLGRGFQIISLHPDYALGATIAGAIAAGGIALAIFVWRQKRWSYLAAGIGALLVDAAPWLARAYVQHIETITASRRWAERSPYVAAATSAALAATLFLVLLAAAAITAFVTAPPAARPALAGAPAPPAGSAGAAP